MCNRVNRYHSVITCFPQEELHEWMNPIYLNIEVQGQIQERFESDSEIELQGFLKEDKYQEVIKALQDSDIDWSLQGPANKRYVSVQLLVSDATVRFPRLWKILQNPGI